MYLFQSDPRIEYLLRPSSDDLVGLEENIRHLQRLLISPSAHTTPTSMVTSQSSVPSVITNSPDLLFQYASTLVSHIKPAYLHEGIAILENLVFEHWARTRRHVEKANLREKKRANGGGSNSSSASSTPRKLQQTNDMEGAAATEKEEARHPVDLSKVPVPLGATAPLSDSVADLDLEFDKEQARLDASEALLPVCYYYLAVGWVKLEDHDKARRAVERMLELKPGHPQGESLRSYIDKEQTKEGVVGLAGVALALAATAGLALAGMRRR